MKIEHIFIDLDGVLVDFFNAALKLHGAPHLADNWPAGEWDMPKVIGIGKGDFWRAIDDAGPLWWASLASYAWVAQLLTLAESVAPFTIATSPSLSPNSYMGKALWLNENIRLDGRSRRNWMLGESKHLLARPGTVLIDDNDIQCRKFVEAGGSAIIFPQPWNTGHGHHSPMVHVERMLANFQE